MNTLPDINPRDRNFIADGNAALLPALKADYDALAAQLGRKGVDIERVTSAVMAFHVAIPSWGVGTGGTTSSRTARSYTRSPARRPRSPCIYRGTGLIRRNLKTAPMNWD